MDIEDWRSEIDEIDMKLLRLLNKRARIAIKVGALKQVSGLPLCDPCREHEILVRVRDANSGPLDNEVVVHLFRQIITASRQAEAERCGEKSFAMQEVAL